MIGSSLLWWRLGSDGQLDWSLKQHSHPRSRPSWRTFCVDCEWFFTNFVTASVFLDTHNSDIIPPLLGFKELSFRHCFHFTPPLSTFDFSTQLFQPQFWSVYWMPYQFPFLFPRESLILSLIPGITSDAALLVASTMVWISIWQVAVSVIALSLSASLSVRSDRRFWIITCPTLRNSLNFNWW